MRRAYWFIVVLGGCNGQFDFDNYGEDAAVIDTAIVPVEDARPDRPADQDSGSLPDGSSAGRITCGTTSCTLPRVCCMSPQMTFSCTENEESACNGLRIQCDSNNDCSGGLVCCGTVTTSAVTWLYCEEPEFCTSRRVKLCDPTDPTECPTCGPAKPPLPTGYYQCH